MDWTIVVHLYSIMLIMITMFIPIVIILFLMRGMGKTVKFAAKPLLRKKS